MTQDTPLQTVLTQILKELFEMKQILATKDDMRQVREEMATKDEIRQIREVMATKDDLKGFATKEDIANMATKDDIREIRDEMATKDDFTQLRNEMATKEDIANMATKTDIQNLTKHMIEYTDLLTNDLYSRVNANTQDLQQLKHQLNQ